MAVMLVCGFPVLSFAQSDTPAPGGKKPFYYNHYGCPTAYYLDRPSEYEKPYATFLKADEDGKLTKLGRDVLRRISLLRNEAKNRTSEMTAEGCEEVRSQMRQLVKRYPTLFTEKSTLDARSIVQNHCLAMASEALVELARHCPHAKTKLKTSHRDMKWMNPQDRQLTAQRNDSLPMARFNSFVEQHVNNTRLIESLFNDKDYVAANIDVPTLSNQLYVLALNVPHTGLARTMTLTDIFTPEELNSHWLRTNAWDYISYGNCPLSGGYQAYLQRQPLWNMLHIGDSVMLLDKPVVHVRYTHRGVLLSMASLMEINDFGVVTESLDSLETLGWDDRKIAPFGGSIVMVHYRVDKNDSDPLVKVLHNGREARLPLQTDCAPYYHWNDVKRYYLRKLYRYEKARLDADDKKK
jgi:hypothetical protein